MVGGWGGQLVAAMMIKEREEISRSLSNVSFSSSSSSFKCDDVSA